MDTIVHIAITPDANAKLTPLELLEDFADASRGWHFLEAESAHYAEEKGAPACLLRHHPEGTTFHVDFAFAATNPDNPHDLELVILDAPTHRLDLEQRDRAVNDFIQHFRTYLQGRPGHASLQVAKDDIDPPDHSSSE